MMCRPLKAVTAVRIRSGLQVQDRVCAGQGPIERDLDQALDLSSARIAGVPIGVSSSRTDRAPVLLVDALICLGVLSRPGVRCGEAGREPGHREVTTLRRGADAAAALVIVWMTRAAAVRRCDQTLLAAAHLQAATFGPWVSELCQL